ncbi:MAG: LAGLIDADG family homing endonuclease [Candidatus Jordarchaeales archaeon]
MQRRLPPEVKEKMEEELKIGVEKGYGYHRVWRMLKESGVEVSRSTVRNYYYRSFPEKLKKRGRYLPRELRIKLYQKVLELRRHGLGYKRIKKKIEELYDVPLSRSLISYWCRNIHSPFNGCRIPSVDFLEPSPELSYIIGVVAGDGWAVKKKNDIYEVGAMVKDRDLIEEFSKCLGKVLRRDPPRPRQEKYGIFTVEVESKALYEILQKTIDINKIAPFVEHCEECMRRFLRGFFDSEGCVSKDGRNFCYNTDVQLLRYVKKILNLLGIRTSEPKICVKKGTRIFDGRKGKTYVRRKDEYRIYIRMSDVLRFYQLIGFTIKRKQKKLENYLKKRRLLTTCPHNPTLFFHIFQSAYRLC